MTKLNGRRLMVAVCVALALAGCARKQSADQAAVEIRGSQPAATAPAAQQQTVDAYGVVTYETYQAAVARNGDTVASVAGRLGLSGTELGAYNGLAAGYPLRAGDELVLPPRPGGYGVAAAPQTTVPQPTATGQSPVPLTGTGQPGAPIEQTPLGGSAGVEAAPAAPANTWSPDLAAAAIDRANSFDRQGNLAAPPSATEPLPPAPVEPEPLQSPNLQQYQTPEPQARPVEEVTNQDAQAEEPEETVPQVAVAEPSPAPAPAPAPSSAASGELRLIRPVEGPIVIGFQQGAGRARNEGVDFAAPAGSPVVAAANGEVALVSQSLGGLGTIVLLRHPNDYLTVYGRIDRVSVVKGDLVSRGQKIGVVSPTTEPRMHFEVRRGAESFDPERFF